MAAGDVSVLGPFVATDDTSIDTALTAVANSGNVLITSWSSGTNQVMFAVIATS